MDFDEFELPPEEISLDKIFDLFEALAGQAKNIPNRLHFARLAHIPDKDILQKDFYDNQLRDLLAKVKKTSDILTDVEFRFVNGPVHREGWGKDYIITAYFTHKPAEESDASRPKLELPKLIEELLEDLDD